MIPPALLKKILFIYCLFLAVLGLRCCTGFSLVVVSGSSPQLQCMGFSYCGAQLEGMWVSVLVARGLSSCGHRLPCSAVYGVFPDQGWNPCFLHWQADSLPLSHQERPHSTPFIHCLIPNFILKVLSILNPFLPFFL